jgi:hypothetical protein
MSVCLLLTKMRQPTDHICLINLQLPVQSMQVLNPAHGEAYSIQHYVINNLHFNHLLSTGPIQTIYRHYALNKRSSIRLPEVSAHIKKKKK